MPVSIGNGVSAAGALLRRPSYLHVCSRMLTYAHVCSRMLTYAHVCSRMPRYAVKRGGSPAQEVGKTAEVEVYQVYQVHCDYSPTEPGSLSLRKGEMPTLVFNRALIEPY
jgi:hypothetical protein